MKNILDDLQPNILKGHGRDQAAHLFLTFAAARRKDTAAALGWIAHAMAPALHQLLDADAFKVHKTDGRQITCLFLSAAGYRKLGIAQLPEDAAFRAGMQARAGEIGDLPAGQGWDGMAGPFDAMLLVADTEQADVTKAVERWGAFFAKAGIAVHVERGQQQRRLVDKVREGVEHFGYVDGRSQPLFLSEQVATEQQAGNTAWNAAFPPAQFLVRDPHGADETSLGAYFVFRKLEQNVRGFKTREQELSKALKLFGGANEERAGAMVVGRFEDGTPLALSGVESEEHPTNDFTYGADGNGLHCPFRAHIRKTNPRGSTGDENAERVHIMARRGITYGTRYDDLESDDLDIKPTHGVGLLFMAYMADIANQFEFTQQAWANNPGHPQGAGGTDPVIGLGPRTEPEPWTDVSGTHVDDFDFRGFVTMRGGEYFFAPSLSGLARLAELAGA